MYYISNNDHQQLQQTQQTQIAKVIDDKDQVQRNFDNALVGWIRLQDSTIK